jgi:transposase
MPKKIDPALRERAVRLVREHRAEYSSTTAAAVAVARQLGVARESVRRWVAQADVDDGARPGVTSEESAEIKRLRAENRRLREDNEILKAATVFFAGSSTPATVDHGVHRRSSGSRPPGRVDLPGAA